MVILAPAHPVYAAQEDRYERDQQAEAQAGAYFERYLSHIRRLPIVKSQQALLSRLEDEVTNALRDLFIAGWDAARDEQRRDGPTVNSERFALGYTVEAAAYEQRTRAEQNR